jgi:8-oxo-dGTP pyrophosphatase MutT (NUDIX family)
MMPAVSVCAGIFFLSEVFMSIKGGTIHAAGGILWKQTANGSRIALVHRPRYNDWTLPKGKLKPGEEWLAAALREVEEETGCIAEPVSFAGTIWYTIRNRPKEVRYWQMKLIKEGEFLPNDEIDRISWLSVERAIELLNYEREKDLLKGLMTDSAGNYTS